MCRWRRTGSGPCLLPLAPSQTALWSSPKTASFANSASWVLNPRTTRTEHWNISTRASWTRPESRCGISSRCWDCCVLLSLCEPAVVLYFRWRCVKPLETPLKQKPGVNTAKTPARKKVTLTTKRYLQHHKNSVKLERYNMFTSYCSLYKETITYHYTLQLYNHNVLYQNCFYCPPFVLAEITLLFFYTKVTSIVKNISFSFSLKKQKQKQETKSTLGKVSK